MPIDRSFNYLVSVALLLSQTSIAGPLAKKGELVLNNPFEGSLLRHELVDLKVGWSLEILDEKARATVAGKTIEGVYPALIFEKSKIGLNSRLAGGTIRNYKARKVGAGS